MDIENNADTTVLGSKCLVIHDFNRPVVVSSYEPTSGIQECIKITGDTTNDQLVTGQTYMLVGNQAINCKNLNNHLLCLMPELG